MAEEHSGNNVGSDETPQFKNRNIGGNNSNANSNESKDNNNAGMTQYLEKMKPFIDKMIQLWVQTAPMRTQAQIQFKKGWVVVKPYYDKYYRKEFGHILLGLMLLFFGGHFAMSIACFTAVQLSGWPLMKKSYAVLKQNWDEAWDVINNDPQLKTMLDENNDGNVSNEELLKAAQKFAKAGADERWKMMQQCRALLVRIDPNEVMSGIVGIWSALLTVIATLRSKFAKDIALGVSMGEVILANIRVYIVPVLARQVDEDMKKWIEFGVATFTKAIGVMIALMIARVVSAFHSAVKGGSIVAFHTFTLLHEYGLMPKTSAETIEGDKFFMITQYALALYGFWSQASTGFMLATWYLKLIFLPLSIFEGILTWVAAY